MFSGKRELKLKMMITADGRYKFDRPRLRKVVRELLLSRGVGGEVSLSVAVVGDRKMRQLHREHLGEDKTTDVLSFSQMEEKDGGMGDWQLIDQNELFLGDVVVSYPRAKIQAREFFKLLDEEIEFLVCHGVLHLLGVHHD
jgi:probable rRNA maturation factor